MLATFTVLNDGDLDNMGNIVPGSLRQMINLANANGDAVNTIVFSETAPISEPMQQIDLSNHPNGGELAITKSLNILGSGARKVTINQTRQDRRIFNIDDGDDDNFIGVTITGVTLSGGNLIGTDEDDDRGGAIYSKEVVELNEVSIAGNSAQMGGGGIYNKFGQVTINRSSVLSNSQGVFNGDPEEDEKSARTNIVNSTFSGNGAGVINARGTVNILQSTFAENTIGVSSMGNGQPEVDDMGMPTGDTPAATVFTNVSGSIFANNSNYDISTIGVTDDDTNRSLKPSITSFGYNIFGEDPETRDPRLMLNPPPTPDADGTIKEATNESSPPGFPQAPGDMAPPLPDFITDPFLLPLGNYGGSTDVFLPNNDPMHPDFMAISPAIDMGNPTFEDDKNAGDLGADFEQRGRHFARLYSDPSVMTPVIDIGAAEVQAGNFVVDTLQDEDDGQFSGFASLQYLDGEVDVAGSPRGDFSLREALLFSELNPEVDTIEFSPLMVRHEDPTASVPPTILLTQGELEVNHEVIIQGPTTFDLEIDASGNDPTPNVNDAMGTRVIRVDNNSSAITTDVTISNLTIMGGDVVEHGGGIFSRENLTLINSWVKQNYASARGGGLFAQFGNASVDSSTFSENFAADDGGAIFFENPTFGAIAPIVGSVVNSTITDNDAGDKGGGIANQNADVTIAHNTITLNSAGSTRGSGVASFGGMFATTTLNSNLISGNTDNDVEFLTGGALGDIVSLGYNIIGNGNATAAFGQPGDVTGVLNPMLDALAREGGPTPIHKPLPGSPAIDAGDPAAMPGVGTTPEFDQRGSLYTRVFDGTQNGTAVIDVGAYELQGSTYLVDNSLDENDGNTTVGNLSLREAIELANINPLPDIIMFDPATMQDATINQTSATSLMPGSVADMVITDHLTIVGLGLDFLTINLTGGIDDRVSTAPMKSRLFTIDDGDAGSTLDVSIQDIRIAGGSASGSPSAGPGGAIYSTENLQLLGLVFVDNGATGPGNHGGSVYQEGGELTIGVSGATGNATIFTANSTIGVGAHGGALAAVDAIVTIQDDTTLSGNSTGQTASHGGAIYVQGGELTISDSSVSGNVTASGASRGGGIYATGTVLNVNGSNLSGNTTAGGNSEGGGLYAVGSTVTIGSGTNISLNQTLGTSSGGGGVYLSGGTANLNNVGVTQNTTQGEGASGGGIYATNGADVTLLEVAVAGNETDADNSHGGGIYATGSNVVVHSSTISTNKANHATSTGGGLWSDTNLGGSQLTTVLNSTVSTNESGGRGGGIYNADGRTLVQHSTVTNNSAFTGFSGFGGGIASYGSTAVETKLESSIVAGNVGSDVDHVLGAFVNSFATAGYNVIGVGQSTSKFTGSGDVTNVADPMLGLLADNGGFTLTHEVLADSPAVNAGSPTIVIVGLDNDQRGTGFDRVKQGRADAGAFESDFAPAADADFDGSGLVDGGDFLAWQRGYGTTTGASKAQGDADLNGTVDGADLSAWQSQFGSTPAVTVAVAAGSASSSAALQVEEIVTASPVAKSLVAETDAAVSPAATSLLASNQWLESPAPESSTPRQAAAAADAVYEQVGGEFAPDRRQAANWSSADAVSELSDAEADESSAEAHSVEDDLFAALGAASWEL